LFLFSQTQAELQETKTQLNTTTDELEDLKKSHTAVKGIRSGFGFSSPIKSPIGATQFFYCIYTAQATSF